jgi:CheY-like chemotaxis protein
MLVGSRRAGLGYHPQGWEPHRVTQFELDKSGTGKTVLVVEDEPDLLEVTRFALECEGFGVDTATNGEEALERLRTGVRPGVVLLDLMMPVMNGWEFLEAIAKIPSLREIPVVVLTAGGSTAIPGAAAVLRKPLDLGLLIETVEHHTAVS